MKESGLTLCPKKCKIAVPSVEFFGVVFEKKGTSPATSKAEELHNMSRPKDVGEVRSLLGMAQYSAQYIPNFSSITAPLRNLTKSSVKWKWGQEEEEAFNKIKHSLSEDSVLGYYELNQPTKLMVDAGPEGLGLILAQKKSHGWQAVVCHSRSLTPAERNYSQMEREALAIRWACERCYVYLIGGKFTIITDHQPLLPMFNNPQSRPPLRIEKWLLYMQQFEYILEYNPGKFNTADYLSRHAFSASKDDENNSKYREQVVCTLVTHSVPKALTLQEVQMATEKDPSLQLLIPMIISGDVAQVKSNPETKMFSQVFPELCMAQGVIMRGNQIVIPSSIQSRVLDICHEAHLGIVKSKQLLRSKVWFHGIDKLMEKKIAGCIPCQAAITVHQRNPLQITTMPERPWQRIAVDFCGPFPTGEYALVTIDEASRYPDVEIISSTSARDTMFALEKIFATHGLPEQIKSDNGPPFQSAALKAYCDEKDIKHWRITPRWPEANGLIENFMKNVDKVARIANVDGKDWRYEIYNFLSQYRAVPHLCTDVSPQSLLLGREIRGKLPQLAQNSIDPEIRARETVIKQKQKEYADTKRRTETHDLHPGDIVIAKQRKTTKITPPYDPTPYRVEIVNGSMVTAEKLSSGKKITRDSSHFKQIKEEGETNQEQYKEQFEEEEKQFETEDKDLNPTPSGADNTAMDNDNSLPVIREDVVTE